MANPNPTTEVFPQIDARLDVDGSTWNLNSITNESVALVATTAASGTAYKIGYLAERPAQANFASSNAAPAISGYTLVTTVAAVDSASKFYVDYDRAFIITASSVSGPVSVTYSGMGSVVRSREINNIHFGHNYLGPKSSAPSVDNEGNALAAGDQYYNTTDNKMYIRTTANEWKDLSTVASGNTITSTDGSNLTLTTVADGENVVINSTTGSSGNTIVLPKVRASTKNFVLAMDNISTGTTTWQATATAPTITSISGALNHDQDSTLTLFGADFKSDTTVSLWTADAGGTKVGSNATITNQTATRLEATFGHGDLNVGATVYVEASNSGITARLGTAFVVSADPTVTFTGGSGASYSESTHLGTYGGRVTGGPQDSNTKLLLNFDRGGGTDTEDSSNKGGDGYKIRASNDAVIKASPFGDGKSAIDYGTRFVVAEGTGNDDFTFGANSFTFEFWLYLGDISTGHQGIFAIDRSDDEFRLEFDGSDAGMELWVNGTDIINGSLDGEWNAKRWYHIAITRSGNTFTFYKDGVNVKSADNSSSLVNAGNQIVFGHVDGTGGGVSAGTMIDEIRIVKGTNTTNGAVYTGNFTVPTSRFSASDNANTKLLIHSNQVDDLSDSGHHITYVGTAVPNTGLTAYTGGNGAWKFDGNSDYLKTPDSTEFDFGTGDFTIEGHFRKTGTANTQVLIAKHNATDSEWYLRFEGSSSVNLNFWVNGTDHAFAHGLSNDVWFHVAVVRISGTTKIYLDGVEKDSFSDSYDYDSVQYISIGARNSGSNFDQYFEGRAEDIRVTKGLGVYTGAFTKPSGPLTTTWSEVGSGTPTSNGGYTSLTGVHTNTDASKVKLLILGDGAKGLDDSSTSDHDITTTGSFHSQNHGGITPAMTWPASLKKTGSAGVYFDGTTDYLEITNWTGLGAGKFTIDFWLKFNGSDSTGPYVPIMGNAQSGGYFNINLKKDGDRHNFYAYDGTMRDSGFAVDDGQWHHCMVTRNSSNVLELWVDGSRKWSSSAVTTNYNSTGNWRFGHDDTQGFYFKGYLDNIRIVVGEDMTSVSTDQVYSSNGTSYTVPTQIYGGYKSKTIPTITFTGQLATNPATGNPWPLASDEDIEFSNVANTANPSGMQKLDDSNIGLTLTNLTGSDKNKAELTGTISNNFSGTTRANLPVKAQVRTERGNAAYDSTGSSKRLVTFSGGTTTEGLQPTVTISGTTTPGYSVTGTGIPAGTTITSIDSATTLTLSADTTGGNLSSQTLHFGDPERQVHVNGSEVLSNSDSMLTIAVDSETQPVLFNARRYMGVSPSNNSTINQEILGFGFQPDLLWFKNRDVNRNHLLMDSVRGDNNWLQSQTTTAAYDGTDLDAEFRNDGFIIKNGHVYLNENEKAHIAWGWKAGGAPSSSALSLSGGIGAGTIADDATDVSDVTSITQSVNQNSGFSITKYTGGGGDTASFPHNLGGTPDFIIIKNLDEARSWVVWHKDLTNASNSDNNVYNLWLDLDAQQYNATSGQHDHGAIAGPSSTVINVRKSGQADIGGVNQNTKKYICYAWKAVTGVSAFGKYTGTGGALSVSDQSGATNCGFNPKYLLIKRTDSSGWWQLHDIFRGVTNRIHPHEPDAEADDTGTQEYYPTFESSGFSYPSTVVHANYNADDGTYIYMAFA